jgi:signal transduction histidine kinase/ActR/RegA family two-component response regulator
MTLAIAFSAVALACYVALMVIALRQSRARLNQAFAVYLGAMTLWQFTALMVSLSHAPRVALVWYRLMTAGMGGQFIFYLYFILVFLGKDRYRGLIHVSWGLFAALLASSFTDLVIRSVAPEKHTGLYVPVFGPLVPVVALIAYVSLAYATFCLNEGYRGTRSDLPRNRIRYLLIGTAVSAIGLVSNLAPALQGYPMDVAANVVNALVIAYAILRYQLLDVRVVFRKGLLYSVPTAIIGASYFLVVYVAVTIFHLVTEYQILMVSLIVAAVTAVAIQPLWTRVQSSIDRLFFRERYNSSQMLQRLSGAAASILDLDRLTGLILDEVTSTIHIERAAFFLRDERTGALHLAAQRGLDALRDTRLPEGHPVVVWLAAHERVLSRYDIEMTPHFKALWGREREELEQLDAELLIPLRAKGELVGVFAVGLRRSEEPYTDDDRLTLATLANQMASAIENARLYRAAQQELAERKRAEEEILRRAAQQEALNAIIAAAAAARELIDLLEAALDNTLQALGLPAGDIWVGDQHLYRGLPDEFGSALASAIQDADLDVTTPTVVTDWHEARRRVPGSPVASLMVLVGVRASIIVPIVAEDRRIGGLTVLSQTPREWPAEQVALVRSVGQQLGTAADRLRLLAQTREQVQQVQQILDTVPEAVVLLGPDNRILLANLPAQASMPALTDAGVGDEVKRLGDRLLEDLLRAQEQGLWHEVVVAGPPRRVFEAATRPVETGPQAGSCVLVWRDVTQERETQQRIHQQERLAAVGQLAAGIAHDFNNVLTAILGYSDLLVNNLDPQSPLRRDAEEIRLAGGRAASLTRQLLAFSRKQVLQVQVLDLNVVIVNTEKMLRRLVGEDIELVTDMDPHLRHIKADAGQMEQVIMNLVVNARDAMPHGGRLVVRTGEVYVDAIDCARSPRARPGHFVSLSVQDSGIGMRPETIEHLFEPFFTTKEHGTGLGLAVVYGIVHQHGGWVDVESEPGKGTVVHIYLSPAEETPEEEAAEAPSVFEYQGHGEGILLVEDETEVRRFAARVLGEQGYEVFPASRVDEALRVFEQERQRINLIFSDVVLPDGNGLQLVDSLLASNRNLSVLLSSGYIDHKSQSSVIREQGHRFLQKPYTLPELFAAIHEAISKH